MRKAVVLGCFIASFLLFITPNLSAICSDNVQSNVDNKVETTNPIIHVRGGLGIHISVYGVTDDTVISTFVNGITITWSNTIYVGLNLQNIHIFTFTLFPNDFQLYIEVNDQEFNYEGFAFLVFTDIKGPIDS